MSDVNEPQKGGLSRRTMIKRAGLAAGAAWVVPTVLSLDVPVASASPGGCTSCATTSGAAPETVLNGTNPTATTSWVAPVTSPAPASPVAAQIALVGTNVFVANTAGGNPSLSGLQQILTFSGPCTSRIALGGVTATFAATLDGQGAGGITPPTGTNGAYAQVQFFNGATAVGSPLVLQTNTATSPPPTSATVPTNATSAVINIYLVKNGSKRATANNISLKLVCP